MKCLLVIDQSTSATKAVLFDESGQVLERVSREHQQHYPQPGWVEHDADEIWHNTLAVAGEVLRKRPECVHILAGIAVTNQRETVVVFDKQTGRPLHRAIVWQCRRGDPLCAVQREQGREPATRAKTGLPIDGYFSASKLQWLIHERPELADKLTKGQALIGTMDTYLIYRLTQGDVFATDHTNASRTLLYDIANLRWDEECCAWWQVPRHALADVRASAAHFGNTTLNGQLPQPLPICAVMGDSQAALFAQCCFEPGAAKVTFGTGSSVLLNVGHIPPGLSQGTVATIAWVHAGRPTYALEGIITCAAATLIWLRDQLGLIASPEEAEAMAREVAEEQEVYLVPAFSGLGAPHWRPAARAAIVGLSVHSDKRHIVRAALEAIAYQLRDVLEMMHAESKVRLRHIQGDGGPSANELLMQFTADIIGVELRVARHPDCSARGVAMMGALGLGWHASMADIAAWQSDSRVYTRTMTPEQVQARYDGWRHALDQVLCAA